MCGIAGILTANGSRPDEGRLREMAGAIAHRGPDGEGIWSEGGVGLAHRRLAIIDLSPSGIQPMRDASGNFVITFNGEIYNYRELREEIGAEWRTESDTEVILEGYRKWGDDVVTKLRGMFAFVLWDGEKKRALFARDRIGKKPLFFTRASSGDLAFASEIKSLSVEADLSPDWKDIRTFLGLQYVPTPKTGFLGVEQLGAGHVGVYQDGAFTSRPYHTWRHDVVSRPSSDIDQAIRTHLEEAVKIRQMASDVPVGAFLSGGVDSAAVVAFASRHVDQLQTFTMGFAGAPDMDEREEAKAIAKQFKTSHFEFEAKPEDLLALVDDLVAHYDAPYADSSALPLWMLARETSKHVKVVLTGDGGDETFGGYRRYLAFLRAEQIKKIGMSWPAINAAWMMWAVKRDPRFMRFAQTLEGFRTSYGRGYADLFTGSYFGRDDLSSLLQPDFKTSTDVADAGAFIVSNYPEADGAAGMLNFDLTSYLPDDLNVKMDRATMRFGLEARAPFLDQELVAFAQTLPLNEKVNHGKTKIALKRALRGVVPDDVLSRPKRGFQVPLATWFRGPLAGLIRERCLDPQSPLAKIVRREAVERLVKENARGTDHGNRLWMLLSLSTWLSRYGN